MESYTYTVGSVYRRDIMVRLDELGIPYTEHRNMLKSIIVVKIYTEAQEDAYYRFEVEFADFERRLREIRRRQLDAKREAERKEQAEKLARKNRFRKLTFRKPLTTLK